MRSRDVHRPTRRSARRFITEAGRRELGATPAPTVAAPNTCHEMTAEIFRDLSERKAPALNLTPARR